MHASLPSSHAKIFNKLEENKKMKLYIETSVPNFLFSTQDSVERQTITKNFFKNIVPQHEAYVSDIYILEAEDAPPEKQKQLKSIITRYNLKILEKTKNVEELAKKYQEELKLPERYFNDLLHIAVATIHEMDVIVSWNLKHIVKLKTILTVAKINQKFKYKRIHICSPEEI